ncbi:NDP-hexose 2,3-dehydratase family protein [Prauserella cavernicola]|uniref:NDP-hexose 2,3-dehydratase family protein n=1 Tax=Prauserella cavernicola TaxID=2800127 RepID=A0A934QWG2_9PSEU|nr:NDP-hexose 2,3-dehydratase family protein [Prauserella cavernicola]MBK1787875.1 NDP-hexose 2,3-dehydratase family protein [Prauserella cavernicola]
MGEPLSTSDAATPVRDVTSLRGDVSRPLESSDEFWHWWNERSMATRFEVSQVPFAELDAWRFDPDSGNLGHESGRFFSVEGLQVRSAGVDTWSQPIINQPEIGILGILVKEFDGVLCCLMQAKMEPGNVNTIQLSPTVQATRSNYTQVHRGSSTRYLEHFAGPGRGRVIVDVLQSEQGAWFWRKRNRNMVVLVTEDIPVHDDFRWLPLSQVREALNVDNLVNMDARTVLSCMPFGLPEEPAGSAGDTFSEALARSYQYQSAHGDRPGLHTAGEILSWFTEAKTRCDWTASLIPLAGVRQWSRDESELSAEDGRNFRIIGVRVRADNREVAGWSQPLLEPRGRGQAWFVTRVIEGVLHVLVRARPEFGLMDLVEMAPTIHLLPGQGLADVQEEFLSELVGSGLGRVRYDAVLSEEGGRFYHALTRYRIVEVGEDFPVSVPPDFCWMTLSQLTDLLRHGHYLNIEARSLLACMQSVSESAELPTPAGNRGGLDFHAGARAGR